MLETIAAIATIIAAMVVLGPRLTKVVRRNTTVKVTLKNGLLSDGNYELAEDVFLLVTSANADDKSVFLESVCLMLPDGRLLHPREKSGIAPIPLRLDPGTNCKHSYSVRETASALKKMGFQGVVRLVAVVRDQLGHEYKSDSYELDVDGWAGGNDQRTEI